MPKLTPPFVASVRSHHTHFSTSLFVRYWLLPFTTLSRRQPTAVRMDFPTASAADRQRKDKIAVILGATGSGKSCLAVDLGGVFPAEIINSDKMQVYNALTITTNQILPEERRGVPHHLLGDFSPYNGEFTAADFRSAASRAISGIQSRGKLPIVAGGSNSFVHALLAERFQPGVDPFSRSGFVCPDLRYDCCFLWVDVVLPVLFDYLNQRVDEMLELGMFEDLAEFYNPHNESETRVGLWKAIGVPEFNTYFRKYPPEKNRTKKIKNDKDGWDKVRKGAYEKAVEEIKENTCQLAKRQLEKIQRLRDAGWDINIVDATSSFRVKLLTASNGADGDCGEWRERWEREVLEPSVNIVKRFLEE